MEEWISKDSAPVFTDRLHLEILRANDAGFIELLVNSQGWIENIGDRNIHSQKDALSYIEKIKETEDLFYWVVRIKESNTPIGIISFLKRNYLGNFDIGFAFLPDFHGQGYAYEAARAILILVSEFPEYNIVLATTKMSNEASIRLLKKLGFVFEKEMEIENQKLHIYYYGGLAVK